MMASAVQMEAALYPVRCEHCLEAEGYIYNPKLLACGHIFCEPCLADNQQHENIVVCVICWQVVYTLVFSNLFVLNVYSTVSYHRMYGSYVENNVLVLAWFAHLWLDEYLAVLTYHSLWFCTGFLLCSRKLLSSFPHPGFPKPQIWGF